MAEPYLKYVYNNSDTDSAYDFYTGNANWREITPGVDTIVFTGGGIADWDEHVSDPSGYPTLSSGTRSPTIRPAVTSFVIPYVFVEDNTLMYRVPLAGHNINRWVFGVSVSGTIEGNCYLEAWDDYSFSTTTSEVLVGSPESGSESYVNAVRTTETEPDWAPGWNGDTDGAAYLRGDSDRVGLGTPPVTNIIDEMLFFNVYIRLETDSSTFHNTPVFGFRYLYT
jgi:hypothetical protein